MRAGSYQTTFAPWKASLLFVGLGLLLTGSTPYEDTKARFALRLPDKWRLTPRFGDLWGMTFERPLEAGTTTALTVHVDPVPALDLAAFAEAAEGTWASNGPVTPISADRTTIAGRPALTRELDQAGRRVRAYYLEAGGHYYHLRFEAPPALARTIEPEWAAIVSSFRPAADAKGAPRAGLGRPPVPTSAPSAALPPGLVGNWKGKGGVSLTLKAERTFSMGGLKGRFSMEGDELVLVVPGRSPLRFTVALDGDALTLSAPNLAEPATYARAAAEDATLAGIWTTEGGIRLSLSRTGKFEMGPLAGRWDASEDRLVLRGERGEEVTYRYGLEGGVLTLSGGDLESPLAFRRK